MDAGVLGKKKEEKQVCRIQHFWLVQLSLRTPLGSSHDIFPFIAPESYLAAKQAGKQNWLFMEIMFLDMNWDQFLKVNGKADVGVETCGF